MNQMIDAIWNDYRSFFLRTNTFDFFKNYLKDKKLLKIKKGDRMELDDHLFASKAIELIFCCPELKLLINQYADKAEEVFRSFGIENGDIIRGTDFVLRKFKNSQLYMLETKFFYWVLYPTPNHILNRILSSKRVGLIAKYPKLNLDYYSDTSFVLAKQLIRTELKKLKLKSIDVVRMYNVRRTERIIENRTKLIHDVVGGLIKRFKFEILEPLESRYVNDTNRLIALKKRMEFIASAEIDEYLNEIEHDIKLLFLGVVSKSDYSCKRLILTFGICPETGNVQLVPTPKFLMESIETDYKRIFGLKKAIMQNEIDSEIRDDIAEASFADFRIDHLDYWIENLELFQNSFDCISVLLNEQVTVRIRDIREHETDWLVFIRVLDAIEGMMRFMSTRSPEIEFSLTKIECTSLISRAINQAKHVRINIMEKLKSKFDREFNACLRKCKSTITVLCAMPMSSDEITHQQSFLETFLANHHSQLVKEIRHVCEIHTILITYVDKPILDADKYEELHSWEFLINSQIGVLLSYINNSKPSETQSKIIENRLNLMILKNRTQINKLSENNDFESVEKYDELADRILHDFHKLEREAIMWYEDKYDDDVVEMKSNLDWYKSLYTISLSIKSLIKTYYCQLCMEMDVDELTCAIRDLNVQLLAISDSSNQKKHDSGLLIACKSWISNLTKAVDIVAMLFLPEISTKDWKIVNNTLKLPMIVRESTKFEHIIHFGMIDQYSQLVSILNPYLNQLDNLMCERTISVIWSTLQEFQDAKMDSNAWKKNFEIANNLISHLKSHMIVNTSNSSEHLSTMLTNFHTVRDICFDIFGIIELVERGKANIHWFGAEYKQRFMDVIIGIESKINGLSFKNVSEYDTESFEAIRTVVDHINDEINVVKTGFSQAWRKIQNAYTRLFVIPSENQKLFVAKDDKLDVDHLRTIIRKCFPAIFRFEINENGLITKLYDENGDFLSIAEYEVQTNNLRISIRSIVQFFKSFEEAVKSAVKLSIIKFYDFLKTSKRNRLMNKRKISFKSLTNQSITSGLSAFVCGSINQCLGTDDTFANLKSLVEALNNWIGESLAVETDEKPINLKILQFIRELIRWRTVVEQLISTKTLEKAKELWRSCLKTFFKNNNVYIEVGDDVAVKHDYEFSKSCHLLFDDYFQISGIIRSIFKSWKNSNSCVITGNSAFHNQEFVRFLANYTGRSLICVDLSDEFDFGAFSSSLKALATNNIFCMIKYDNCVRSSNLTKMLQILEVHEKRLKSNCSSRRHIFCVNQSSDFLEPTNCAQLKELFQFIKLDKPNFCDSIVLHSEMKGYRRISSDLKSYYFWRRKFGFRFRTQIDDYRFFARIFRKYIEGSRDAKLTTLIESELSSPFASSNKDEASLRLLCVMAEKWLMKKHYIQSPELVRKAMAINEALRRNTCLILSGPPGCGKSTLINFMEIMYNSYCVQSEIEEINFLKCYSFASPGENDDAALEFIEKVLGLPGFGTKKYVIIFDCPKWGGEMIKKLYQRILYFSTKDQSDLKTNANLRCIIETDKWDFMENKTNEFAMIDFRDCCSSDEDRIDAWMRNMNQYMPFDKAQKMLRYFCSEILLSSLRFRKQSREKRNAFSVLLTFEKLFEGQLRRSFKYSETDVEGVVLVRCLFGWFVFALVWSFGAFDCVDLRMKFEDLLRIQMTKTVKHFGFSETYLFPRDLSAFECRFVGDQDNQLYWKEWVNDLKILVDNGFVQTINRFDSDCRRAAVDFELLSILAPLKVPCICFERSCLDDMESVLKAISIVKTESQKNLSYLRCSDGRMNGFLEVLHESCDGGNEDEQVFLLDGIDTSTNERLRNYVDGKSKTDPKSGIVHCNSNCWIVGLSGKRLEDSCYDERFIRHFALINTNLFQKQYFNDLFVHTLTKRNDEKASIMIKANELFRTFNESSKIRSEIKNVWLKQSMTILENLDEDVSDQLFLEALENEIDFLENRRKSLIDQSAPNCFDVIPIEDYLKEKVIGHLKKLKMSEYEPVTESYLSIVNGVTEILRNQKLNGFLLLTPRGVNHQSIIEFGCDFGGFKLIPVTKTENTNVLKNLIYTQLETKEKCVLVYEIDLNNISSESFKVLLNFAITGLLEDHYDGYARVVNKSGNYLNSSSSPSWINLIESIKLNETIIKICFCMDRFESQKILTIQNKLDLMYPLKIKDWEKEEIEQYLGNIANSFEFTYNQRMFIAESVQLIIQNHRDLIGNRSIAFGMRKIAEIYKRLLSRSNKVVNSSLNVRQKLKTVEILCGMLESECELVEAEQRDTNIEIFNARKSLEFKQEFVDRTSMDASNASEKVKGIEQQIKNTLKVIENLQDLIARTNAKQRMQVEKLDFTEIANDCSKQGYDGKDELFNLVCDFFDFPTESNNGEVNYVQTLIANLSKETILQSLESKTQENIDRTKYYQTKLIVLENRRNNPIPSDHTLDPFITIIKATIESNLQKISLEQAKQEIEMSRNALLEPAHAKQEFESVLNEVKGSVFRVKERLEELNIENVEAKTKIPELRKKVEIAKKCSGFLGEVIKIYNDLKVKTSEEIKFDNILLSIFIGFMSYTDQAQREAIIRELKQLWVKRSGNRIELKNPFLDNNDSYDYGLQINWNCVFIRESKMSLIIDPRHISLDIVKKLFPNAKCIRNCERFDRLKTFIANNRQIILIIEDEDSLFRILNYASKLDPWQDQSCSQIILIFLSELKNPSETMLDLCTVVNMDPNEEFLKIELRKSTTLILNQESTREIEHAHSLLEQIEKKRNNGLAEIDGILRHHDVSRASSCFSLVQRLENFVPDLIELHSDHTSLKSSIKVLKENERSFDEISRFGASIYLTVIRSIASYEYTNCIFSELLGYHENALAVAGEFGEFKSLNETYQVLLVVSIYKIWSKCLMENHRIIFGFSLISKILQRNSIDCDEMIKLITRKTDGLNKNEKFGELIAMGKLPNFSQLAKSLRKRPRDWSSFLDLKNPKIKDIPEKRNTLGLIQKLCVLQLVNPVRLLENVRQFNEEFLKFDFIDRQCIAKLMILPAKMVVEIRNESLKCDDSLIVVKSSGIKIVRISVGGKDDFEDLGFAYSRMLKNKRSLLDEFEKKKNENEVLGLVERNERFWIVGCLNYFLSEKANIEIYIRDKEYGCKTIRLLHKIINYGESSLGKTVKIVTSYETIEESIQILNSIPKQFSCAQNEHLFVEELDHLWISETIETFTNDPEKIMIYSTLYRNLRRFDELLNKQWFNFVFSDIHFKRIIRETKDLDDKAFLDQIEIELYDLVIGDDAFETKNVLRALVEYLGILQEQCPYSAEVNQSLRLMPFPINFENELNIRSRNEIVKALETGNEDKLDKIKDCDIHLAIDDLQTVLEKLNSLNQTESEDFRCLILNEIRRLKHTISETQRDLINGTVCNELRYSLHCSTGINQFIEHIKKRASFLTECLRPEFLSKTISPKYLFDPIAFLVLLVGEDQKLMWSFRLNSSKTTEARNQSRLKTKFDCSKLGDVLMDELGLLREQARERYLHGQKENYELIEYTDSLDDNGQPYYIFEDIYVQNAKLNSEYEIINADRDSDQSWKLPLLYFKAVPIQLKPSSKRLAPLAVFRAKQANLIGGKANNEFVFELSMPFHRDFERKNAWNLHLSFYDE